jgi:hypothetical protein
VLREPFNQIPETRNTIVHFEKQTKLMDDKINGFFGEVGSDIVKFHSFVFKTLIKKVA